MSVPAGWGDIDNDGSLDLFVGNWNARNWMFRNNRDGTFTKLQSAAEGTDISALPFSSAWGDYDNDGWLDLIVAHHSGTAPHALYRNAGGGVLVKMTSAAVGPVVSTPSTAHSVAWGDYDNDGWLDVFIGNGTASTSSRDLLYHNDGTGRFQAVVNNPITSPVLCTCQGTWSDFDNDGDLDLFVTHYQNQGHSLYRNDRASGWVDIAATNGLGGRFSGTGAAWGDYDNDGDLDLFVTSLQLNGPVSANFFYRNMSDATFERVTSGALAEDRDQFVSCAWLDYDNDGWLDLFATVLGESSSSRNNRLYRNQGDGTFAKLTQGTLVTDTGDFGTTAWGDYDNDGFPDLFVTMGTIYSPQRSALYHNDGNSNSWIKIRCVGTVSNRSAIGTKVRVKAAIVGVERWQMRQIAGSEGWATFNSLDALIGLGDATVIDTLRVEWPSGIVQEFHGVPVKQTLTLVERTDLSIAVSRPREFDLLLQGPRQQRYRVETSIDLANWSLAASLTITSPDGTASFKHLAAENEAGMFFRARPE